MDFILSILFSSFEYFVMFLVIFRLFRFRIGAQYITRMLFASFILASLSYTMRSDFLSDYTTPAMLLILILFLRFVFDVSFFHSMIMAVTGYIPYGLIQALIISGLKGLGIFEVDDVFPTKTGYSVPGYIVSLLTIAIFLLISRMIRRRNLGFDFVPHGIEKTNYKGLNLWFLVVILISIVVTSVTYFLLMDFAEGFYIIICMLAATFAGLMYLNIRKDLADD